MKSSKSLFLGLALLLGLSFSTLNADDYSDKYCYPDPCLFKPGFSLGVYGTFHTVFFNVRNVITEGCDGDRLLWRYDSIQDGPGGGAFISYDWNICDCLVSSIRLDAFGLAETSEHAFRDDNTHDNVLHQAALRWAVDLSCQPGVMMGDCVLGYLKIGATLGGVREQASIRNEDEPWEIEDVVTVMHHPGGYVLGTGVRIALTDCLSIFAEYDRRSYVSRFSSITTDFSGDDDDSVDTKITNAHSSSFSLGLATKF